MADAASQKPKVVLHWLEKSRSQRIVWLLEECKNVDWEVKTYKRKADMLAPDDLKKVHPLGKSPTITIQSPGATSPITITESSWITEYLADHFAPHLVPKKYAEGKDGQPGAETESWLRYHHFLHYAEGTLFPILFLAFIMENINKQAPFFVRPITKVITGQVDKIFINPNAERNFTFLEENLKTSPDGGKYLCGKDLTAADILLSFPLIAAKSRLDMSTYPKVKEYIDLLESNPGYVKSIATVERLTGEKFSPML